MANRVEFSVSATPVAAVSAGENIATETIAKDMQKTLGGSGSVSSGETNPSVTVDFTTTTGYSGNTVAYQNVNNTTHVTVLADATNVDMAVFKHTGHAYSTATALGDAVTRKINIMVDDQNVACLAAGEAIVLPLRSILGTVALKAGLHSSGSDASVALECFFTT